MIEEFVNIIAVGNCPQCGSAKTGDCDSDPEIQDVCVGRCYDCGNLWCLEYGQKLDEDAPLRSCCDEEDDPEQEEPESRN